jgi:hypothetical protein
MPPPGQAGAGFSFAGTSATNASVVSRRPEIDAAFCSAVRVTLVGSTTPAFSKSPYSPPDLVNPALDLFGRTFTFDDGGAFRVDRDALRLT